VGTYAWQRGQRQPSTPRQARPKHIQTRSPCGGPICRSLRRQTHFPTRLDSRQHPTAPQEARICQGPTSGLVNRHNGSPERRIWLVEVVHKGAEGKARGDDARVTEEGAVSIVSYQY
jgi:hypothetical protein